MAVYYYKLWSLLREKGINQKKLTELTGLSTATIFQMKRDEYVSLSVLDRIAKVLNCDYGDMITNIEIKTNQDGYQGIVVLVKSREVILEELQKYMQENELSMNDLVEITGLSLNTLKKFLRGENISQNSYYKLLRLGSEFGKAIMDRFGGNIFSFF